MSSLTHPPDGDLRALLDGELPSTHHRTLDEHLAGCATCRARLSALASSAREAAELLDLLPNTVPELRLQAIVSRARGPRLRWSVAAAGLAIFLATVAGATVGRPYVRTLVARVRAFVRSGRPVQPRPGASPDVQRARVAFVPGPNADISFDASQSVGVVNLSLADSDKLVIDPTEPVAYRVSPDGVVVHNGGSRASYEIIVPRNASHVRILVAGLLRFEKRGARVSGPAPTSSAGSYVIELR